MSMSVGVLKDKKGLDHTVTNIGTETTQEQHYVCLYAET